LHPYEEIATHTSITLDCGEILSPVRRWEFLH
jgi:hypothetical protein